MAQGNGDCFGGLGRGEELRGNPKSLLGRANSRLKNVGIKEQTASNDRVEWKLEGIDPNLCLIRQTRGKGRCWKKSLTAI